MDIRSLVRMWQSVPWISEV